MELRAYGAQTTIYFPLIDFGLTDFEDTPVVHASGDSQFSEDGAAFGNTTNDFAHEGNGIYSLVLEGSEVSGKQIVITIIDQSNPKLWEDQAIIITTFGNSSAETEVYPCDVVQISGDAGAADNLELDYDGTGYVKANSTVGLVTLVTASTDMRGTDSANTTTPPTAIENADALLIRDLDNIEGSAPDHSLTTALLKLVSRVVSSSGTLTIYRTDGTTPHVTQTVTGDDEADPIVEQTIAA